MTAETRLNLRRPLTYSEVVQQVGTTGLRRMGGGVAVSSRGGASSAMPGGVIALYHGVVPQAGAADPEAYLPARPQPRPARQTWSP